ncbi:MAG: porin family protein [Candidatus Pseudobacter hemicellulosilyticus]|uniref:Porin family protein n=1 Tax=Candidatus Pseudobacter hemicellulosilyticus TaxID=3121375 RepID=A0AAJ5WQX4_9BACT|nr:MAG: porin family protein [Pseudobacter sp.]
MKKLFLLVVSVTSFVASQAQFDYGVKGGFNISNIGGADVDDNKARILFHVGMYGEANLAEGFRIRPEIMYSAQGATFEAPGDDVKYNLGYISIPVLAKYNFSSGFGLQTGPQFAFLTSAKRKVDGDKDNIKDNLKGFDFGWVFGAAYQPSGSPFGVDARFNLGLSRLDEDGDSKWFNRVFQIGVFYQLGTTN